MGRRKCCHYSLLFLQNIRPTKKKRYLTYSENYSILQRQEARTGTDVDALVFSDQLFSDVTFKIKPWTTVESW